MSPVPGKNSSRAFTLIELLVVIGLIAILIAATLSIVPKVKRAVYGASTQSQLAAIATAIQAYYNDYHAYPGPLANNQLYTAIDSNPQSDEPGVFISGTYYPVVGTSGSTTTSTMASSADATKLDPTKITGSENLFLGLFGGLRAESSTTPPGQIYYHPEDIFSLDGVTPTPKGPASLNLATPKRQQAYLQLKSGDISIPSASFNNNLGGSFADSAGRSPKDTLIPVLLDKYGEPLPILYFRTNIGGAAIAGFRSTTSTLSASTPNGTPFTDANGNTLTGPAQYDLSQNVAYTGIAGDSVISTIGQITNTDAHPHANPNGVHGLQGLGNPNLTDPLDTNVSGTNTPAGPTSAGLTPGNNGLAYFKDPSLNTGLSSNTNGQGVARQKDGFVLISAGPDRQYGTHDDLIYPGPLQP